MQCKFSTYTQSRASIPKLSLYGPFFLFFSLIFRISYALYSYLFQCNNELSFRRLLSENRLREVHNKMFTGLTNLKTLWVETFMSLHKTVFTAVYINMHIYIYSKRDFHRNLHGNAITCVMQGSFDGLTHIRTMWVHRITTPHLFSRLPFLWTRNRYSLANVKLFIESRLRNNIATINCLCGIYRNLVDIIDSFHLFSICSNRIGKNLFFLDTDMMENRKFRAYKKI